MNKIAVKIGRKASKLRLANVNAYRAIDIDSLFYYVENNADCNVVIIENIAIAEEEAARNFVSEFKSRDSKNKILFFITDIEDEVTSGLADETDTEIIMNNKDLQTKLYEQFKINASTYLDLNKKIYEDDNNEESLDDLLGDVEDNDIQIDEPEDNIDIDYIFDDEDDDKIDSINNIEELLGNDSKIKEAFDSLKNDYMSLMQKHEAVKEEKAKLEEVITALDKEKNDIVKRFNDILANDDVNEEPISLEQYKEMKDELGNKDKIIDALKEKRTKLEEEISSFKDEMYNKEENINELKESLKKLESDNKKITNNQNSAIEEAVSEKESEIKEINNKLAEATDKLNNEMQSNDRLSEEIKAKESQISQLEEAINGLTNKNKDINSKLAQQASLLKNKDSEIDRVRNSTDSSNKIIQAQYETQINELETKLKVANEQLENLEEQYNNAIANGTGGGEGAEALLETNKTLQDTAKKLREELGKIKSENNILKREASQKDSKINNLNEQLKGLNEVISGTSIGGSVSTGLEIETITYNQNAQIIAVIGGSSCGITTTAMSIAHKLSTNNRVLFIDFDLQSPMADAWFMKNPLCTNIVGIPKNDQRMSALGIFFELGIDKLRDNYDVIRKTVESNRNGMLDYIGGIYYSINNDKVAYANYNELFNFVGGLYDYIVVDLGEIGSDTTECSIINNIIKVSSYGVIVTTKDYFAIRSVLNRMKSAKIDISNMVYLLNMCINTNVDDRIRKLTGNNKFGMMMAEQSMIGKRETFIKNRQMRENFDIFCGKVLFSN